jgi:hypothetical protein
MCTRLAIWAGWRYWAIVVGSPPSSAHESASRKSTRLQPDQAIFHAPAAGAVWRQPAASCGRYRFATRPSAASEDRAPRCCHWRPWPVRRIQQVRKVQSARGNAAAKDRCFARFPCWLGQAGHALAPRLLSWRPYPLIPPNSPALQLRHQESGAALQGADHCWH